MSDANDTMDLDQPKSGGIQSSGQMLKKAREQLKLSHIDVARELKLRVQWIVDIENDNYKEAAALIYVRGYLRSYAKLVHLSQSAVLEAFDQMNHSQDLFTKKASSSVRVEEQFVRNQPALSHSRVKKKTKSHKKRCVWLYQLIALVVIALLVFGYFRFLPVMVISRPTLVIPEQKNTQAEAGVTKQARNNHSKSTQKKN